MAKIVMDKTKIGIIAALGVALAGFILIQQRPPGPSSAPQNPPSPSGPPDPKLVGGVTTLQVQDVKVGTGPGAKNGDTLSMDYTGTLLDGTEFDSSIGKAPFSFTLGQGSVIKGWDQGLVGMKVGGERNLTIPASLGYGDSGQGSIPPGATLKFDVTMLSIKPGP